MNLKVCKMPGEAGIKKERTITFESALETVRGYKGREKLFKKEGVKIILDGKVEDNMKECINIIDLSFKSQDGHREALVFNAHIYCEGIEDNPIVPMSCFSEVHFVNCFFGKMTFLETVFTSCSFIDCKWDDTKFGSGLQDVVFDSEPVYVQENIVSKANFEHFTRISWKDKHKEW